MTVIIAKRRPRRYHTTECHAVKQMPADRLREVEEPAHRLTECKYCAGEWSAGHPGEMEHYQALKEAQE